MTTAPDVDWDAAEQRARRLDLLALLVLAGWFGSWAALTDGLFVWTGTGAWWAVAGYLVLFAVLLVLQRTVPRLRRTAAIGHRVQFALRRHVDPGPGAREKADVHARRQARLRWVVWSSPLLPLTALANGRWDRPAIAVPAAVVFLACTAVGVLQVDRQVRRAQRWVADPPGPDRDVAPPTRLETWTSGRRLVLAWGGLTVVGVLVGVLLALVA